MSVRLAAESKLLSERHVEDKDSFGSCLLAAEAGSCRQSCGRCTAASGCCKLEVVADQAVAKLFCSASSSCCAPAGSLQALCLMLS